MDNFVYFHKLLKRHKKAEIAFIAAFWNILWENAAKTEYIVPRPPYFLMLSQCEII